MATLTNTFDGGTPGDTITTGNSGGGSGDEFTLTASVTGGTCTFSSSGARSGLCMSVTTAGTALAERRGWAVNSGDTTAVHYFRFYIDPASITGTVAPLRSMNSGSGGQRFRVQVSASGVVSLLNNASTTVWSSSALAAGTQWRIEAAIGGNTSTTGRIYIFAGEDTTPSQDSGLLTGQNFGGPHREVWFGQTSGTANVTLKIDDCGWSDTALLGPAGHPAQSETASGSTSSDGVAAGVAVTAGSGGQTFLAYADSVGETAAAASTASDSTVSAGTATDAAGDSESQGSVVLDTGIAVGASTTSSGVADARVAITTVGLTGDDTAVAAAAQATTVAPVTASAGGGASGTATSTSGTTLSTRQVVAGQDHVAAGSTSSAGQTSARSATQLHASTTSLALTPTTASTWLAAGTITVASIVLRRTSTAVGASVLGGTVAALATASASGSSTSTAVVQAVVPPAVVTVAAHRVRDTTVAATVRRTG